MMRKLVALLAIVAASLVGVAMPAAAEFDWQYPDLASPSFSDFDHFIYSAVVVIDGEPHLCFYYLSGYVSCAPMGPGRTIENPPEAPWSTGEPVQYGAEFAWLLY